MLTIMYVQLLTVVVAILGVYVLPQLQFSYHPHTKPTKRIPPDPPSLSIVSSNSTTVSLAWNKVMYYCESPVGVQHLPLWDVSLIPSSLRQILPRLQAFSFKGTHQMRRYVSSLTVSSLLMYSMVDHGWLCPYIHRLRAAG